MLEIDKGIPRPASLRAAKYPWAALEIGDSFFVPSVNGATHNVASVASWAGKRHGKKFSSRTVDGGVRVWRIA